MTELDIQAELFAACCEVRAYAEGAKAALETGDRSAPVVAAKMLGHVVDAARRCEDLLEKLRGAAGS